MAVEQGGRRYLSVRTGHHSADHDVIVIGGGQAGLAVAYYLRRTALNFQSSGRWRNCGWGVGPHLELFAALFAGCLQFAPGWPMPPSQTEGYPSRDEVIEYLTRYEQRYNLPINRTWKVETVTRDGDRLRVGQVDGGSISARAIVSATGTWSAPFTPDYTGRNIFRGTQLHSAHYQNPQPFADKRVLVVGGGNSGAQILAELSDVRERSAGEPHAAFDERGVNGSHGRATKAPPDERGGKQICST